MNESWASRQSLRVLLVEDSPLQVKMVELATAELSSFQIVHVAKDGVEATEYLEQAKTGDADGLPDIVLCDINMPRMDGFEFLKWIRSDDVLNHTPVVMLTTSDQERDISHAYREGASSFITKPIDILGLEQILKHFVSYWEAAKPAGEEVERALTVDPALFHGTATTSNGVLIVEDSPTQATLLEHFVSEVPEFHLVGSVRNGSDALDFVHRRNAFKTAERPDIVLLDLNIPEPDGLVVLDEIKQDANLQGLIVVILTERDSWQDRVGCYRKGANTFLVKPSTAEQMAAILHRVVAYWCDPATRFPSPPQ